MFDYDRTNGKSFDYYAETVNEHGDDFLDTLEEILAHLRNWFVQANGIHTGTFRIGNGNIEGAPFIDLDAPKYYRIFGSSYHDGVQYGAFGCYGKLEEFSGAIWVLAIPEPVIELAKEIHVWQKMRGIPSPYQSESFGGYTYTRATNSSGQEITWREAFRARLNRWRKI